MQEYSLNKELFFDLVNIGKTMKIIMGKRERDSITIFACHYAQYMHMGSLIGTETSLIPLYS